ncbi:very short patch repair endonuclease [Pseudomonas alabamensis]|uniref:very short patch repair endonuclease n=1 Tax=Pseudomonas alabamensis TaxID=3064349 RepID=UPI003F6523FA
MADTLTPEQRRYCMQCIKGKDTKPELKVRKIIHRLGYRYRLHGKQLPGSPDIILPKHKLCIFVHGCFWHRHDGCRYAYTPKTRLDFWEHKFSTNVTRDINTTNKLLDLGWRVEIIWECQTKQLDTLMSVIQGIFNTNSKL